MTYEQELAELNAKHEEKKQALIAEHRVLAIVGDLAIGRDVMVHYSKLYGARGSIHFNGPFSEYTKKGEAPDAGLLRDLLAKFPPVPLVQVKDGCTSFRPADAEWKGDIKQVYPVTIRLETYTKTEIAFEWYAKLGDELWSFKVCFPLYKTDIGQLDLRWHSFNHGQFRTVEHCDFRPNHGAQRIRWASGGNEYPNQFTIFWWDVPSIQMHELIKP